jgi:hypothetical protein
MPNLPNVKIIAVAATAVSISAVLYLTTQSQESAEDKVLNHVFTLHANATASRRNLAAGIDPTMFGGGLQMGEGPWSEFNTLQLFSSTPNNPRQYAGVDTEFVHYKNASEQNMFGESTFPPTDAPTELKMFSGGFRPTAYPTEAGGGAWTNQPASRVPTKRPVESDDYYYEDTKSVYRVDNVHISCLAYSKSNTLFNCQYTETAQRNPRKNQPQIHHPDRANYPLNSRQSCPQMSPRENQLRSRRKSQLQTHHPGQLSFQRGFPLVCQLGSRRGNRHKSL